jgi:MFS family permease
MWTAAREHARENPAASVRLRDLVSGRYRTIFAVNVAVAAGAGAQYYLTSGFLPTLLDSVLGAPPDVRGGVLLAASLVVVVSAAAAGELSERFGRRPVMLAIGGVNVLALPLITLALTRVEPNDTRSLLLWSCLLAFLANAAYAPVMIFLNERYPTATRARGTAISWNTGFMLGGLTPTFVNLLSPSIGQVPGRLALFLVGGAAVFVAAVLVSPETRGNLDRRAEEPSPAVRR